VKIQSAVQNRCFSHGCSFRVVRVVLSCRTGYSYFAALGMIIII